MGKSTVIRPVILASLLAISGRAQAQMASTAPEEEVCTSYTTVWQDGYVSNRSIMFPHEIDGCKIMVQSKTWTHAPNGATIEHEGPDCNCDLIIDGRENMFDAPEGYRAKRLLEVCEGKGVDGATEERMLNRESLKLKRDFSHMPNVVPF